jgi:hypothetical protein
MSEIRNTGVDFTDRHHKYYIDSADLHVVAQKTLFRVHGYFFSRESSVFSRTIDPASPGHVREGKTDSDPIILEDVSPEEFEKFLWVFYNPKYSIYNASVEDWRDILNLADKWGFPEVKELAVRELHKKKELNVVSKLALYQQYRVDLRHLIPLYGRLCERPTSLTREEAKILGLDATVLISTTREMLRAKPSDGGLSPLPASIEENDVLRALESSLDLEVGSTKKFREQNTTSSPAPASPSTNRIHENTGRGGSRGGGGRSRHSGTN